MDSHENRLYGTDACHINKKPKKKMGKQGAGDKGEVLVGGYNKGAGERSRVMGVPRSEWRIKSNEPTRGP